MANFADLFESAISDKTKQPANVVSDALLDSLRRVESSNNPKAVNPESGAMGAYQFMPNTVKMLNDQGIKFDPFNEAQSREAAKTYLTQLVNTNSGDLNKALAQYGGFKTKDPSAYISNVLNGSQQQLNKSQPIADAPQSGTFANLFEAAVSAPTTSTATETAPPPKVKGVMERMGDVFTVPKLKDVLQTAQDAKSNLPGFLAATGDVIASAPGAILGTAAYIGSRFANPRSSQPTTPEQAQANKEAVTAAIGTPIGRMTGLADTAAYKEALPTVVMEAVGKYVGEKADVIAAKTGLPVQDVQAALDVLMMAAPVGAAKAYGGVKAGLKAASTELGASPVPASSNTATGGSVGAAAVPNATMIQQALLGATPELQTALSKIPVNQTSIPAFVRHIEADSLPMPVRLTEGQSTGDIVKLSNEQNRRGRDPELAQRFNEQNGQLVENLSLIRDKAAPDVFGSKTIENSQGLIDAYKNIDAAKTTVIRDAYKELENANGGQFPVDGKQIALNSEAALSKKLKSEFLPSSIKTQLDKFKAGEQMTFENYEALRTNTEAEIRKAERAGDGNAVAALSIVRKAVEDLPLQGTAAAQVKPLADVARKLAKDRFDMLKRDPAYNAAVNDTVAADNFINKFVIRGVNKNIQEMVTNLGRDTPAHQHMAAGTINYLTDKAGIVDGQGNFSQAGFNKALKNIDDVKNVQEIFNPEIASNLKTLGNVARYTQAQPRGSFVNNSNTLVGALAEKGSALIGKGVEKGLNLAVPGLQAGTSLMEMRARRAAAKETKAALELGAGTKQTGNNPINKLP